MQACLHCVAFYDAIGEYLMETYPSAHGLASLIGYQRETLILPDYDRERGKSFQVHHAWPEYFDAARTLDATNVLPEPRRTPGMWLHARDQLSGERLDGANNGSGYYRNELAWGAGKSDERWLRWIEQVALGRASVAMHSLQDLEPVE